MSRTLAQQHPHTATITFLCQECGHDLEPWHRVRDTRQLWVCAQCSTGWTYTERGWERVTQ